MGEEATESMTDRQNADAVEFLERCHDALRQHTGCNPGPYLKLWSQAEDVSLMGVSVVTRLELQP